MRSQVVVLVMSAIFLASIGVTPVRAQTDPNFPQIVKNPTGAQMIVDGKPYMMLCGELHNSSSSSIAYMQPIWPKLTAMNLNTVIATACWDLIEPVEGQFDFTLVDGLLAGARSHHLRLVLIYFGAYKNANSDYAPAWVLSDIKRFPRMQPIAGQPNNSLCPLNAATLAADSKAFSALMRHLRDVDKQHTVIAIQVENECGLLGASRDHSPVAESAFGAQVPAALMEFLSTHAADIHPVLEAAWQAAGHKTSGSWSDVFGSAADEAIMAWNFGRYVSAVAEAGKKEYPLPMYANDWLKQPDFENPGQYPSGGPTAHMLDIWRAASQSVADAAGADRPPLDLFAPDIYAPDFRQITADYHRAGNPLFIPESNQIAGRAYYAFGEHHAICYSPFAIDSYSGDQAQSLAEAYQLLSGLSPLLLGPYASRGIMIYPDEDSQDVDLDAYRFHVTRARRGFGAPPPPTPAPSGVAAAGVPAAQPVPEQYACGLIISLGDNEFLIAGSDITATVEMNPLMNTTVNFVKIEEGTFTDGRWTPGRRLNGDENHITLRQPGELKIKVYPF